MYWAIYFTIIITLGLAIPHFLSYREYKKCKKMKRYLNIKDVYSKLNNQEGSIIFYDGNMNYGKVWWTPQKFEFEDDIDLDEIFSSAFLCSKFGFSYYYLYEKFKFKYSESTYYLSIIRLS